VATLDPHGPGRTGPGFGWRAGSPVAAVLLALFLSAPLFAGLDAAPMSDAGRDAAAALGFGLLLLVLGVVLLRGLPAHDARLAVAPKGRLPVVIGLGVAVGFGIVVGAGIIAAFGVALDEGVEDRLEDLAPGIGDAPWQVVLSVIALVVLAPLGEELLFRALLLRALVRRMPFWWAALASGLAFALAHTVAITVWPRAIALLATGLALAWIYRRRGYWAAVAAHATVNGIAALAIGFAPDS
jgi:membrane protease YdiL (CAAX protease family)